jgi:hypothetical protein
MWFKILHFYFAKGQGSEAIQAVLQAAENPGRYSFRPLLCGFMAKE